jgi:hypothetical protein
MKNITKNKIFVIVSSLAMLLFNFYAEWLPINGVTRLEVLNSIPIYFMPSNYVYNIWYVIYAGLIIFNLYLLFSKKDIDSKIAKWIVVANIVNIIWIFVWHYLLTGLAVIAVSIIFISLVIIFFELGKKKKPFFPYAFFSIYTPWMMVAMLSNFAASNYMARGGEFFFSSELTAIFLIILITIPAVITLIIRNDFIFSSVILFSIFGILTKHFYQSDSIVATAMIASLILFVGVMIGIVKHFLSRPSKP